MKRQTFSQEYENPSLTWKQLKKRGLIIMTTRKILRLKQFQKKTYRNHHLLTFGKHRILSNQNT